MINLKKKYKKGLSLCPCGGALLPSSTGVEVLHAKGQKSHMLRVVLQTADKLLHRFSLIADLIDGGEEGEPAETTEDQEHTEEPEPRNTRSACSASQHIRAGLTCQLHPSPAGS